MTKQNKQLLLKDLSARLPYDVKFQGEDSNVYTLDAANYFALQVEDVVFKPYLRSMSSMTEEEKEEYEMLQVYPGFKTNHTDLTDMYDWLLSHHFDFRGLIPMGLALKASEDMYKTE